jgi:tape measure domain-containing protein
MAGSDASTRQLQLQISASTELLLRNLKQADQAVGKFASDAERQASRVDQAFEKVGGGVRALLGLLGGVSVGALARDFLDIADKAKGIESQLRLATASFGDYGQAQTDVQRIAKETRNDLAATSSLYGNFVRSSQDLGKTQAQAARATETFSKALKIGGADTNAAASATLQFGQALASGVLRGDEFNSIAEASPRILQLLADALGVSRGEIRGLAEEGKLTSEVLYKALTETKFTDGIDTEFRQLPVTFGESMTAVSNAAITVFGAFDSGGEFSTMLANFVSNGAAGFATLAGKAEEFGVEAKATIEGLASAFAPVEESGASTIDFLRSKFKGLRGEIADLLGATDDIRNFGRDLPSLVGPESGYIGRFLAPYMQKAPAANTKGAFLSSFEASERTSRRRLADKAGNRDSVFRFEGDPLDLANYRPPAPARPAAPKASGKAGGGKLPKAKAGPKLKVTTLADRLKADEQGTGSYISADLASAGSDAQSLLSSLGNVDTALAGIRTGLEGVDLGSLLSADEQRRLEYFSDNFRRDLTDGLGDAVFNGANLGDVLFNSLKRAGAELLSSGLLDLLKGGAGGGVSGLLGSAKKILGFADGGSPPVGRISLVGERGPELFVPKVSGTIIPNHALGGHATSMPLTLNMTVTGVSNAAEMRAIAVSAATQAYQMAVATSGGNLRQAMRPGLPATG